MFFVASLFAKYRCKGGIKYRIRPLNAIATPARMKAGSYFPVMSYNAPKIRIICHKGLIMSGDSSNEPPIGGPINDAIPWKRRRRPKAFVKFSNPNKSTKITEVRPGMKNNFDYKL